MKHQYLLVLSRVPLIIVRVPLTGPAGKRRHTMRWRELLRALTDVMNEHELRQKDISSIENFAHPDEPSESEDYAAIDRAFAKGAGFEKFWFYEWRNDAFALVREGGS